ncbi:MAG: phosphoribosylanthranilate isomerase [Pseudomonadota bacterium]
MKVKICGVTSEEIVTACAQAGAAYIGFNHFEKSPRFVTLEQVKALGALVPVGMCKVSLLVDPDDAFLDALMEHAPIDMIQLHGSETPERVLEVKARTGLPVMKVVGLSQSEDLAKIDLFAPVADQILVDAKAPQGSDLPGGNGVSFDWDLLAERRWSVPWMLAGGLTVENVTEAVRRTGADQVDVASGVERAPGIKDMRRIEDFIAAAAR